MTRKDRFIWSDDDIEVHPATAWSIAHDAARDQPREIKVVDTDPMQAAHRAIDAVHSGLITNIEGEPDGRGEVPPGHPD